MLLRQLLQLTFWWQLQRGLVQLVEVGCLLLARQAHSVLQNAAMQPYGAGFVLLALYYK